VRPENTSNRLSILVVDDEESIREGSGRILTRMGYQVYKASRGSEGLEILGSHPIEIVLLDLKMPGMDGMEVLAHIQRLNPEILVIIITGYATLETAVEAMKQGAYDFIAKPFEPDQLRIVINRAKERIRLTEETEKLAQEQQRNLADLGTEKSRIRTIVESLPNGVLVTNVQGQVALMNPAFQWLMGIESGSKTIPEDKATGEPIEACILDKGFCQFVEDISAGKAQSLPATYEFTTIDEKYLMASGRPVLGDQGECLGAVVNLVDITAMKVLDRLKSEFVAKVSHELRSPLSTIHEQLALVLKDMVEKESPRDQYLLSRAKEKTQGLISLIGDLLDLSRIEAGNVCSDCKPVKLDDLLKSIVDFMETRAIGKNQSLKLILYDAPIPLISADPRALESVFGNLIANAINYTRDGGAIEVKISLAPNRIQPEKIRIDVSDTGFGIEAKDIDNIFKRFYRVKNEKTRFITGTGLGLPIVKGLLDELGGSIQVKSEPSQGSTFTVLLPLSALNPPQNAVS
jgi:two-component system, OmpR family, phosphate regulon sensor histidine kinase PhoR